METYICLLRGVNVGGHHKVKMKELKDVLSTSLGLTNIQTYIQSGNIVFQHQKMDPENLAQSIQKNIEAHFGFKVPVIVIRQAEYEKIIDRNPFIFDPNIDPSKLHVTFLSSIPKKENLDKIDETKHNSDEFLIFNKAIYLYCPSGYRKTKLTNNYFEKLLNVATTTRNWKTTSKLEAIAEASI